MLVPELLHRPALSVGPPKEQGVTYLLLENNIGNLAYGANGQLQPAVSLCRNRDGGLADHGNRYLHKLTVSRLCVTGHPKGPLVMALFFDAQDRTSLRLNRIHHSTDLLYC